MPETTAAEFKVKYLQILDEKGNLDDDLEPKIDNEKLLKIYKTMVLARMFDEKAIKLQRTGRMATYAPAIGQEASQVGSVAAMKDTDMVFPAYRQNATYIYRGFPLEFMYLYWKGHEDGLKKIREFGLFPINIPVGSMFLHAAGYAHGQHLLGVKDAVTIAYTGDGGTSEGENYEAWNFAGVFNCKTIFIVENNQYAISTPRARQTRAETIAQKGVAAGINCIQTDGNDFLAVYKAVEDARKTAVEKSIPTIIENVTYRMSMHTTADDPSKYRTKEEENAWADKDPIKRARMYLEHKGIWSEEKEVALREEYAEKINEAARKADELATLKAETLFEHVYEKMPQSLIEQLEYQKRFLK